MRKIYTFLLSFLLIMTQLPTAISADEEIDFDEYEIYPKVQSITYAAERVSLDKFKSVYLSEGLDKDTVNHFNQVFSVVGNFDKKDNVDRADIKVLLVDDTLDEEVDKYQKTDAHTIKINDEGIEVVAKDTDAAFHAITTINHIFTQANGVVQSLEIYDYADTVLRGFIEGFYGIPWSNKERMKLMEFGSQFKMNTYLFAPKDDPYHNEKWREPYPQDMLAELARLVDVGNRTKNRFVWLIHPFMNDSIRNDNEVNFQTDIAVMLEKFDQLYEIGVRQFGVNADDVFGDQVDAALHVKVMNEVQKWNDSKEDNYNLIFTPSVYNEGFKVEWDNGPSYLKEISYMPEEIHIMWTGNAVLGHVTQRTINQFKENLIKEDGTIGRNPYFWFNWPVNDINMKKLFMGPGDMLLPVTENLDGIATNPMQQAEASKVGLFAVADYAWNLGQFDKDKSWQDSFKYIDSNAPSALMEISRFMRDTGPEGWTLPETEDLKPLFEQFNEVFEEASILASSQEIIDKMIVLENATETYRVEAANKALLEEISPWVNALKDTAKSMRYFLESLQMIEQEKTEADVWNVFANALKHYENSKKHEVQNIEGIDKVTVATKYVTPFLDELKVKVNGRVSDYILGGKETFNDTAVSLIQSEGIEAKLTEAENLYTVSGISALKKDDFIGIDLGRIREVENIKALVDMITSKAELEVYVGNQRNALTVYENETSFRYLVLKNEKDTQANLDSIVLNTNDFVTMSMLETNFKTVENEMGLFNEDYRSRTYFRDDQENGKYVTYDLGQIIELSQLDIVLNKDEHDYIRNASIQVSTDNENFVEFGRLGNGEDNPALEEIYTESYSEDYIGSKIENEPTPVRYIKILIDKEISVVKWARINEIIINEGAYLSPINNPGFTVDPIEAKGHHPHFSIDQDLGTYFKPVEGTGGSLHYIVNGETRLDGLTLLKNESGDALNISVKVSKNNNVDWVTLDPLTKSYNEVDLSTYDRTLEIKLRWDSDVELYQMIPLHNQIKEEPFIFIKESVPTPVEPEEKPEEKPTEKPGEIETTPENTETDDSNIIKPNEPNGPNISDNTSIIEPEDMNTGKLPSTGMNNNFLVYSFAIVGLGAITLYIDNKLNKN